MAARLFDQRSSLQSQSADDGSVSERHLSWCSRSLRFRDKSVHQQLQNAVSERGTELELRDEKVGQRSFQPCCFSICEFDQRIFRRCVVVLGGHCSDRSFAVERCVCVFFFPPQKLFSYVFGPGAIWTIHELGSQGESPHVQFSDCKLSAGARMQRVFDEFFVMVKKGCDAADAAMIKQSDEEKRAAEQMSSSGLPSAPIALPLISSMVAGVVVERRVIALSNVIFPCLNTLRSRIVALVHETIQSANRSALESVLSTSAEGIALNRCKVSIVVQSVVALAEAQFALFVERTKDAVHLNMESAAFQEHVLGLLIELVVTPLTSCNIVLHAMHSALVLQGIESLYNRGQIETDFAARIQDAKRQMDSVKDKLGEFAEKLSKVQV